MSNTGAVGRPSVRHSWLMISLFGVLAYFFITSHYRTVPACSRKANGIKLTAIFLARRSARFLAAALLSAIFFSMTASSSRVKGRNVGRLFSESFSAPPQPPMSDMVQRPRSELAEETEGVECGRRRSHPLLEEDEEEEEGEASQRSKASSCTWSGVAPRVSVAFPRI